MPSFGFLETKQTPDSIPLSIRSTHARTSEVLRSSLRVEVRKRPVVGRDDEMTDDGR
jgi:hypothetical protein